MQVNGSRVLTYADFIKGLDPKGKFNHRVIDLTVRANDFLDDMVVVEANNGTALETTLRTEVPTPIWTKYYGGVPSNKGSKAKFKVAAGTMATKILVDKRLYDKAKDKDAVLFDEVEASQAGMKLEMGNTLIYGRLKDNPLAFNGLMKYYTAYSTGEETDRQAEHYVLNAFGAAGGTNKASEADLASILLVTWGTGTICAFHPEGDESGGIEISEKKEIDVADPDLGGDATYRAYCQYLYWTLGLAVRDVRAGGRICNIQRNDMLLCSDKGLAYIELVDRLAIRVRDGGKQAWYMDKTTWEYLTILYSRMTRANAYSEEHVDGRVRRTLKGIPVRLQDCMGVKEEKVPAFAAA